MPQDFYVIFYRRLIGFWVLSTGLLSLLHPAHGYRCGIFPQCHERYCFLHQSYPQFDSSFPAVAAFQDRDRGCWNLVLWADTDFDLLHCVVWWLSFRTHTVFRSNTFASLRRYSVDQAGSHRSKWSPGRGYQNASHAPRMGCAVDCRFHIDYARR